LINASNSLPESYQQRLYEYTIAVVQPQIQQVENTIRTMAISVEAAHVDSAIHLDYMTSKVVLEEPQIRSTDPNIPIQKYCMDDELHFGMRGGSCD